MHFQPNTLEICQTYSMSTLHMCAPATLCILVCLIALIVYRPLYVTLTDSSPCITSSLCTGSSFCTPTISHTVTIPSITVNEVHTHTHIHMHARMHTHTHTQYPLTHTHMHTVTHTNNYLLLQLVTE